MKNNRILLFLALLLLFGLTANLGFSSKTITITDLYGRKITLNTPVKRIVGIGPGALRLITYIDGIQRVVGVENIDKRFISGRTYNMIYFQEFQNLPTIGQGGPDSTPDPEKLISVNPDVIFVASLLDRERAEELQEKTKIPVVALNYGNLGTFEEELYVSLELLGKILNKEDRAKRVVNYIKNIQTSLRLRTNYISEKRKPSVYVGALGFKGARGIESTQGFFPLFTPINAKNVADSLGKRGSIMIEKEKLLIWDPDIIFIDLGNLDLVKQDYQKNPEFYRSLKAFKTENIYGILPYNNYTTNIDTALVDMYWVAKVLYPKEFKDIDPSQKAVEIYTFFFGERGKDLYKKMEEIYGGFRKIDF